MKMIAVTAQILIGITLLWLGLSGFLHLMLNLPLRCIAEQSMTTIFLSPYLALLFGLQLLGTVLLLVGRWRLLTHLLLGPIVLNLVFFHLLMGSRSFISAALLALLEFLAIWICRRYFRSAFFSENQLGSP
jgi:putative oxidoreductase